MKTKTHQFILTFTQMRKRLILISFASLGLIYQADAQVGIGNSIPNSGSILDLTNSSDKALLLPTSTVAPSTVPGFNTAGMLFYYQDKLFLKTSTGINSLSPWTFDGTNTNGTSTPSGMPVAIGLNATPSSPVLLQIATTTDITVSSSTASIAIGAFASTHMLLDNDEILVKTNATTGGVLKLQEDGGTVSIRSGAAATTATVFTANGSIDAAGTGKILQNGLDLVPTGTIVIWNGTVNASGYPMMGAVANTNWKICDGTLGTPDLRERFVVGSGGDNPAVAGGGYTTGNTGGEVTHVLSVGELPSHGHTGTTTSNGAHSHDVSSIPNGGEGYTGAFNSSSEVYKWAHTGTVTSTPAGSHSHTLTINNNGSGTAHENRPPYYALIYIMKM
jgi:microcystin-dependent protein